MTHRDETTMSMQGGCRLILDERYTRALDTVRAMQRAYDSVSLRYQAREIGDVEYLAARQALAVANAEFDAEFGAARLRAVLRCAEWCHDYNVATNPAVLRTEDEHADCRARAREARRLLSENFSEGVDYTEGESGMLIPVPYRV